jgi:hypothetical protein
MESIIYRRHRIIIDQDEFVDDPRSNCDYLGEMVCVKGRYVLGDEQFDSLEDCENYVKDQGDAVVLPLYLYDHSGITMSTTPFSCPWDSGQVGFIYVDYDRLAEEFPQWKNNPTESMIDNIKDALMAEVKEYDAYLRGEVYGYRIEPMADSSEIVCEDSCWGYYGDPSESGLLVDAKDAIMYAIQQYTKNAVAASRERRKEKRKLEKFYRTCWAD